jgi:AcrR family transcriptional regulator
MVREVEPHVEHPHMAEMADLPSWMDARAQAIRAERRDAAENRERILAAARSLFAERGVDAVTMQDIARAAGVGQGTLYRRYPHKGALCEALLDENFAEFYQEAEAGIGAGGHRSALDRLEFLLTRLVHYIEEKGPLLGGVVDAFSGDRRCGVYRSPMYVWLHGSVAALLRQAEAASEIAPLDIDYTADALLAPFNIDLYLFQREERGFSQDRIIASLRHLLNALRAST